MVDLAGHTTPKILHNLFPELLWKIDTPNKELYLTFDDGPIPNLTVEILSILKEFNVNATFFCVGDNINKHPKIFEQVLAHGHSIGNHTYNHLKAWKISVKEYLYNVEKAEVMLCGQKNNSKKLFRPPYGQITPFLQRKLHQLGYQIVMWDILSKDYKINLNNEAALRTCLKNSRPGSIIVFHDNLKARDNVLNLLPMYIKGMLEKGYKFKAL